jgi:hypothetical protein
MERDADLKNGNLWMALPFSNESSLQKTQKFFAKKDIPTFNAVAEMMMADEEEEKELQEPATSASTNTTVQSPHIQIWN